jgi:hypothetical protein
MSSATDAAEVLALNFLLNTQTATRPTTWYVALHTGDPGEAGTANEVANLYSYARTAITFGAAQQPSTGFTYCTNSGTVTFPTASGGAFGTVSHISIVTSGTYGSGTVLFKGALTANKTVSDGDTFQIQAQNLTISLT